MRKNFILSCFLSLALLASFSCQVTQKTNASTQEPLTINDSLQVSQSPDSLNSDHSAENAEARVYHAGGNKGF